MANNSNNLNVNSNNNVLNNTDEMKNTTLVLLAIGGITLLIFIIIMISIYVKTHRQNKIQNHVEEELLSHTHDAKDNPIDIAGTKIPSSTIGNEYSLNFWLYINSLEYRGHHNKQILMKGDPGFYNKSLQAYTKSNPAIYIEENSNSMKIVFEKSSGGEYVENKGCFRIFDIDTNNDYNISVNIDNVLYHLNNNQGAAEFISESEDTNHNLMLKRLEGSSNSYYIINDNKFLKCDGSQLSFNVPNEEGGNVPEDNTQDAQDTSVEPEPETGSGELIFPEERLKDEFTFIISEIKEGDSVFFTIKPKNLNDENKENFVSFLSNTTLEGAQDVRVASNNQNNNIENFQNPDEVGTPDEIGVTAVLSNTNNLFTIKPVNNLQESMETMKTIDACRTEAKESPDNMYFGMHLQNQEMKDGLIGTVKPTDLESSYCYINQDNLGEDKLIESYAIDDKLCKIHPEVNETYGSNSHMYVHGVDSGSTFEIFEIKNIPLQRWVCINITVRDHIVDVFFDGLLYKTFTLTGGSPKPNNFPIILGNNGGFDGYLSRITWSNKALHPGQIYNKYKAGPRVTKGIWHRIKGMFGGNKDTLEGKSSEE